MSYITCKFYLLVGVEMQGGFFFFSQVLHFRFVVVSGASVAFLRVCVSLGVVCVHFVVLVIVSVVVW